MSFALGTRHISVLLLFAPQALTTTTNGASVDLKGTASPGLHEMRVHLNVGAAAGTTPTLNVKIQDSPDNVTFTDVSGAAFAQQTGAAVADLFFRTPNRYARAVATIGGTAPSFTFSVDLYAPLRNV